MYTYLFSRIHVHSHFKIIQIDRDRAERQGGYIQAREKLTDVCTHGYAIRLEDWYIIITLHGITDPYTILINLVKTNLQIVWTSTEFCHHTQEQYILITLV